MSAQYILICLCFFYLLLGSCSEPKSKKPNILFILADDMGWQDTSIPFGKIKSKFNQRYQTPALNRLANEGIKATNAYSCAVCSPSRVSLMTGQNEARHGVTQWTYLSGDAPSSDLPHPSLSHANWNWNGLQPTPELKNSVNADVLPSLLRKEGYRTMHFGKGHLGAANTPGADPKIFGFDIRIGGRDAGGCGSYLGTNNFGAKRHPDGPWRAWDLDHYFGQDIHLTEVLTLEAKREIKNAVRDDVPFFCYFSHYAPHTPIEPDERFAQKYRDKGLDNIEAAYASLIEGVDKSVGDLLVLLDELKIANNTIVVFTSDNGGLSHDRRSMSPPHTHNAPLSSGKGAHHEGGIRVPLIVRWPSRIPQSKVTDIPIMIYDWYPTLLEIAGISVRGIVDGLSLVPIFDNQIDDTFDRSLIWHFPNFWGPLEYPEPVKGPGMGPCSAIRKNDWKMIYYYSDQQFELFNLANDLGEQNNIAKDNPERVALLSTMLTDYLKETNAPMPKNKSNEALVAFPLEAYKDKIQ